MRGFRLPLRFASDFYLRTDLRRCLKHWKHQTGCQVTCRARRISPSARLSRNDQWRDPRGQSPYFSQKRVLPHLAPPQGTLDWLLKKRSVGRDSHKVNMLRHVSTHAVWWHNTQTPLGMRQCRHGISLEILFGKYSGNLFEIHFGSLSGILPDTCSAILSGIGTLSLAKNPAPYLTYIAPFHLTYILVKFLTFSLAYILAFFLESYLTSILAFHLTFYLT